MNDEQIITWAYGMFGSDCAPLVNDRNAKGEACLAITNTLNQMRYFIPMAWLREITYLQDCVVAAPVVTRSLIANDTATPNPRYLN